MDREIIRFNCGVKDFAHRSEGIRNLVVMMAEHGVCEPLESYQIIRRHWHEALYKSAELMSKNKARIALAYINGNCTMGKLAKNEFYNVRTIRRYIRDFCELVRDYYLQNYGIVLNEYK